MVVKKWWFVLLLLLAACVPQERDLPFETIDLDDGALWGLYWGREPKLVVLTGSEELEVLNELIPHPGRVVLTDSEEIAAQGKEVLQYPQMRMQSLDWGAYFVVIAFQGLKNSTGYGVTIKRIVQQGESIIIHAQFKERRPEEAETDVMTSPVHVVKVKRDKRLAAKEMQFSLLVDGRPVANTSHFVP